MGKNPPCCHRPTLLPGTIPSRHPAPDPSSLPDLPAANSNENAADYAPVGPAPGGQALARALPGFLRARARRAAIPARCGPRRCFRALLAVLRRPRWRGVAPDGCSVAGGVAARPRPSSSTLTLRPNPPPVQSAAPRLLSSSAVSRAAAKTSGCARDGAPHRVTDARLATAPNHARHLRDFVHPGGEDLGFGRGGRPPGDWPCAVDW